MKPGATTRSVASIVVPAFGGGSSPGPSTRIRSPSTTTVPGTRRPPVPSTIVPPVMIRSTLSVTFRP